MKLLKLYITTGLLILVVAAGAVDSGELIKKAEELWMQHDYKKSQEVLERALEQDLVNTQKAEVYWRQARNLYDIAEAMPREAKDERMENYKKMQQLSRKCADLAPKMAECYLFLATGKGRESTQKGILNTLGQMEEIENLYKKVIELKPEYRTAHGESNTLGDAYYALGIFYRLAPDSTLLKLIYGTKGDEKKSIEMLRKAVGLEPERIEYAKELGISLICYGMNTNNQEAIDEGIMWLKKIQDMTEYKPTDSIDKKHARMILADPDMACGYSRDEQQDVSEESLKKKVKD